MGRWKPDAQGRLAKAAFELYSKRGFEETTVEDIAKRAGLTERTFFRHFADKREVFFAGANSLRDLFVHALEGAPASQAAIDALGLALEKVAMDFPAEREFARTRQRIILENADLQERERIKLASLASDVADALRRRGVGDIAASLAGEMGVAVFRIAFERWIDEANGRPFPEIMRDAFGELKLVATSAR